MTTLISQKQILLNELQEFENSIYLIKILHHTTQTKKLLCMKLTSTINKHGEDLHREIDTAVKKLKI